MYQLKYYFRYQCVKDYYFRYQSINLNTISGIDVSTMVGGGETSPPFTHLAFPHEDFYTSDPDSLAPSTSFSQVPVFVMLQ